ncbi:nuclear body protein SP140-like protein isoform X2 [Diceros bicornis minor]|uniref:nuclear body protein SP140-like protein isoform X2 n=1 Tax=Diceros bicornis minor TaxID=77932 RepID=UPI0026F20EDF|nr:nuclear body protein SP140-like protein isoform X2 [Diceros bicornis minor]
MADGGSDFSTRTSTEDQNVEDRPGFVSLLMHFKRHKLEISSAIKKTFPFLEGLRDQELITQKMYEDCENSCRNLVPVHKVVYNVLCELEKTFDLPLLQVLFSKVNMQEYPDLRDIYESFKNVISNTNFALENNGERMEEKPNIQLSLEQGIGENSHRTLTWSCTESSSYHGTTPPEDGLSEHFCETGQINAKREDTTSDKNDALESQPANEQCARKSEPAGINNDDFSELSNGEEPLEISSSVLRSVPRGQEAKTENIQASDMMGVVNLGNNSTLGRSTRKRRLRMDIDESVDFHSEILPVTCGPVKGMLHKRKLKRGTSVKCIQCDGGNWITLKEFEVSGGHEKSNNWKLSVRCGGKTLHQLIEEGSLSKPPRVYGRKKKLGNTEKCKVCLDEGKLCCCRVCLKFFHDDCHIPPMETERCLWTCTFCRMKETSGSQHCHRESEVLARRMGPKEQLKCEFLLLKVYCHVESSFFAERTNKYDELTCLDKIKKRLNEQSYRQMEGFVQDMRLIFQNYKASYKDEFEKNFKEVFAIRETNENSSLV